METEIKKCQNCDKEFKIEPEDFAFYEKVKVPPSTWCPECRLQRRLIFRNYNNFYKRKCDLCRKNIISNFSPKTAYKVYCIKCWWSDKWNPMDYGEEIDFSKPFFEQYQWFKQKVPVIALMNDNGIRSLNCEYTHDFAIGKNCYLVFSAWYVENSLYSYNTNRVKDVVDSLCSFESELLYETIRCDNCYQSSFLYFSQSSHNCHFGYDLRGCSDCFLSAGLRNKKYHILNKPYSKQEYESILKDYHLDTYAGQEHAKDKFRKLLMTIVRKPVRNIRCINVVGDDLKNCKNVFYGFDYADVIDSKYVYFGDGAENSYDISLAGKSRWCYESITCDNSYMELFGILSWVCHNIIYSNYCHSSSNLFGCVGLRNKQYCILNKQYSKEEYERLVPKIIDHMNKMPYISRTAELKGALKGAKLLSTKKELSSSRSSLREIVYRYGEFFPPELSPFAYNETIAQEYFPLTKEQALKQGYTWKDPESKDRPTPTIKAQDLPDNIKDVDDSIVNEIIQCSSPQSPPLCQATERRALHPEFSQCTTAFRIIPQELEFYRKLNLPLPRYCPNCRHYQRIKQRNPLKLWRRSCQCAGQQSSNGVYKNTAEHFHGQDPCPNEFETTYSPDRKEIVYCEQCYLKEVV